MARSEADDDVSRIAAQHRARAELEHRLRWHSWDRRQGRRGPSHRFRRATREDSHTRGHRGRSGERGWRGPPAEPPPLPYRRPRILRADMAPRNSRPTAWVLYAEPVIGILAIAVATSTFMAVAAIASTAPN